MGLPAGLGDAWNLARERKFAEADSTKREAANIRPRPATQLTAIVLLRFEAGMRGVMTVSQVSAGRKARLWLSGRVGRVAGVRFGVPECALGGAPQAGE